MSRRSRCVLPGVACHVTQRGVDRRETFSTDQDRAVYIDLLRENLGDAQVGLLGWCLMPNHVHLVVVPEREDSLAVLLRRVHGRYAQYYNIRASRIGHLWQNRYFACALGRDRLWTALAYVDRNPVRAEMVTRAADYRWSSAAAHQSGFDAQGILDMEWWTGERAAADWADVLHVEDRENGAALRGCTHAGRPFGNQAFVSEMSDRFERSWVRGRPRKQQPSEKGGEKGTQIRLSPFLPSFPAAFPSTPRSLPPPSQTPPDSPSMACGARSPSARIAAPPPRHRTPSPAGRPLSKP